MLYYIAIYGTIALYTITATVSDNILQLQDGISIVDEVNEYKYNY